MPHTTFSAPDMSEPPSRYDVTVRVGKDDGHQPDPAAFAVAASTAASSRNASVVSAHTAEEVIWVVGVTAPIGPLRLLLPWPSSPTRSGLGIRSGHPAGKGPVPDVVRRLEEHRLPELFMAAVACDPDASHAAAAPGRFPGRLADRTASSSPAPPLATAGDRTGSTPACSRTEKQESKRSWPG